MGSQIVNPNREIKNGFGRAVSRILSAPLRAERIICLSSRYPESVPLSRNLERAAPGFPIWPCTRWGFPCRVACASSGALLPHLFTITADSAKRNEAVCFLWHCPSESLSIFRPRVSLFCDGQRPPLQGYAASRPLVFGLSSPGSRRKRFSALPKPMTL